jgi:hypothetical protein
MATIDRSGTVTGPVISNPQPPIDPTYCPTCLSGFGPTNPWDEEVIAQPIDANVRTVG